MSDTIYSCHNFMLPFIIECDDYERDIIKAKSWQYKKYKDNYNEIAYFHSFFKDSMFTKDEDANSLFFTKDEYRNSPFIISKSKEYELNLKSVNLRIFKTGVGILSFHIENKKYTDIKDILEINDYGRRIYPEYLDEKLQCTLVPDYIQLKEIKEDYKYEQQPTKIKLSKIITEFLPEDEKIIRPAIDDRMFVICFYKNNSFSNELKKEFTTNDKWYEYIFLDGNGLNVQNLEIQQSLVKKATYPRWQVYGTMYGISRYSFVCVADESDFIQNTVEIHMQTVYFQMFSLLLMLRATILKFSKEVSDIAQKIDSKGTDTKVEDLYKRYIQFVNSFYFREITAKEQGLELYDQAREILRIDSDIKDLDNEIGELHRYVSMIEENENTKKMDRLQYWGFPLLFLSLITGFFGMNIFPQGFLDSISNWLKALF